MFRKERMKRNERKKKKKKRLFHNISLFESFNQGSEDNENL